MAFPFASAYQPVQRLADMQMQINAAEQARDLEMRRMAQAERQAQLGAALQARQLQDAQAARELQAALSFRQQAAQEGQFGQQLGLSREQIAANERMAKAQLESQEKIATLPRLDAKSLEVKLEGQIAERDAANKANAAAAIANAKLEEALHEDVKTDKGTWMKNILGFGTSQDEQARGYILHPTNTSDIQLRKQRLAKSIPSKISPELAGLTKWDGTQFVPVGTTTSAGGAKALPQDAKPAGLSSIGPFDEFRGVSFAQPDFPDAPVTTAPVVAAPGTQPTVIVPQQIPAGTPFSAWSEGMPPTNSQIAPITRGVPQATDRIYTPTTDAEFEAVPEGARFVNLATGKIRIKNKKSSAK